MDNYPEKLQYLLHHQGYICPICRQFMTVQEPLDLHHMLSKTKHNKKKFPLFIDSLLNLRILHSACHLTKIGGYRIRERQAQKYEDFLKKHEKINKFVNEVDIGNV